MTKQPPQSRSDRLQAVQETIPVLLQASGYIGFVAAQILWLGFNRPEPEFMALMIGVCGAGYLTKGVVTLKKALPDPPQEKDE